MTADGATLTREAWIKAVVDAARVGRVDRLRDSVVERLKPDGGSTPPLSPDEPDRAWILHAVRDALADDPAATEYFFRVLVELVEEDLCADGDRDRFQIVSWLLPGAGLTRFRNLAERLEAALWGRLSGEVADFATVADADPAASRRVAGLFDLWLTTREPGATWTPPGRLKPVREALRIVGSKLRDAGFSTPLLNWGLLLFRGLTDMDPALGARGGMPVLERLLTFDNETAEAGVELTLDGHTRFFAEFPDLANRFAEAVDPQAVPNVINLWRELGADAEPWWATLNSPPPPAEPLISLVSDTEPRQRPSTRIETPRDLPRARRAGGR